MTTEDNAIKTALMKMSDVDKAALFEICGITRFKDTITLHKVELNWWQTNHHVRQVMKEPQRNAKKV